jgi:hypothetical protein
MYDRKSTDKVSAEVTVVDVNADVVTMTVADGRAKYLEVGQEYEAQFLPRQPKKP